MSLSGKLRQMKWLSLHLLLMLIIFDATAFAQNDSPLDTWRWRMPLPQGNNLLELVHARDTYVATCEGDQIVISTNGFEWRSYEISVLRKYSINGAASVFPLTFGGGRFLAIANCLTNFPRAISSLDGITWTNISDPLPFSSVHSLAGGPARFVAITGYAKAGEIMFSTNGFTWNAVTFSASTLEDFSSVAYLNDKFLLIGQTNLWWSDDGTFFSRGATNVFRDFQHFVWADGQYVAVDLWSTLPFEYRILSSTNGANWQVRYSSAEGHPGVAYAAGRFVATEKPGFLVTSTNGMDWESHPVPLVSAEFGTPVGGPDGFALVGRSGNILFSTNGLDWMACAQATRNNFRSITYNEDSYVAVGNKGKVVTSADGTNWAVRVSGTVNDLRAVAGGLRRFVAVGQGGATITSTNGIDWSTNTVTGSDLFGITCSDDEFVSVGEGGAIFRSTNGSTWTAVRSPVSKQRLHGITRGPNLFVATGREMPEDPFARPIPLVLTSPDGVAWTRQSVPFSNYLENVTFGNGLYVAVGSPAIILISSNGVNWTNTSPRGIESVAAELDWVTVGNGTFIVVGYDGVVLTSRDGFNWTRRYSGFNSRNLRSVVYAQGVFTIAANNDSILQSGNVLPRLTCSIMSDGFEIKLHGETNRTYLIETSTNLSTWIPSVSITNEQSGTTWKDALTERPGRFYRALPR